MNRFVQTLESRQMFSAAPLVGLAVPAPLHLPATHAAVKVNQPFYFQGSAINADGSLNADLLITVKPNGKGYVAAVTILNPRGKISTAELHVNAQGQFTYRGGGETTLITGQLSDDKQTITATGTNLDPSGTSTMTINCTRSTTAPLAFHYTGKMFGTANQSAGLTATLFKTDTGYLGVISPTAQNPNNGNGRTGVLINMDLTGNFSATVLDDTGQLKLSLTGQLSSDAKTLTGSLTDVENGIANQGTFALKR